jgi:hypothetical protein
LTAKIRAHTPLPIAVGFGISNPEQARTVAAKRRRHRRRQRGCQPHRCNTAKARNSSRA